jgi:NTE family protein
LSEDLSNLSEVNLVLCGGGHKGVAHIALLEYLERNNIKIKAISATSSGALVAILYCSGERPQQILDFFKTTPVFKYTWVNPLKYGLFDTEKYVEVLEKRIKHRFEDLDIPLIVNATNIEENRVDYFSTGSVIKPILATCAFPAVFSPVSIAGKLYADGGVMDNFPIEPFLDEDTPIIGSYVNTPSIKTPKELNSILKVTNHANTLLLEAANTYKFPQTFHTFQIPVGDYGVFDSKKIDEIYAVAKEYFESFE